jgi:hypothetical protein
MLCANKAAQSVSLAVAGGCWSDVVGEDFGATAQQATIRPELLLRITPSASSLLLGGSGKDGGRHNPQPELRPEYNGIGW